MAMQKMKKLITILTFFIPIILIGQKTKEIVVKFPNSKQIRERYTVLKTNKKIKNGEYVRYFKSSKQDLGKEFIYSKGNFENGQKNGMWEYFETPSNGRQGKLTTREFYKNGDKTGIWENHKYEEKDHVILKYDYDKNIEVDPEIMVYLEYPVKSKGLGIEGEVDVKFKILADCTFDEIEIIKSLNAECDKEVLRRFNRMSELRKKYGAKMNKCEEKDIETTIKFTLMK